MQYVLSVGDFTNDYAAVILHAADTTRQPAGDS